MTGPLDGITVIAMEQAVSAPFATRHLGDLGARVIKVERVGAGDFARDYDHEVKGLGSHFVWVNRSKESLALDFKDPAGREILDRLIGESDVVVQNLAPGTMTKLGLDADQLVAAHPRLIACDISGYGEGGPYETKRAYDLLVQAEAASIATTGWPDRPAKPGIAIADLTAGIYAHSAILAALYERTSTGKGRAIKVSMMDALAEWMGYTIYFTQYSGRRHEPNGISHPSLSPYESFDTADGRKVVVGVQNDREWERLAAKVLERPELADDERFATAPARTQNREEVTALCSERFAHLTLEAAVDLLDGVGIACGRVNLADELVDHPQLASRDRWREVDSPAGPIRSLLPPPIVTGWQPRMDPIPDLGEHSRRIAAELDLPDSEINRLIATGVLGEQSAALKKEE